MYKLGNHLDFIISLNKYFGILSHRQGMEIPLSRDMASILIATMIKIVTSHDDLVKHMHQRHVAFTGYTWVGMISIRRTWARAQSIVQVF